MEVLEKDIFRSVHFGTQKGKLQKDFLISVQKYIFTGELCKYKRVVQDLSKMHFYKQALQKSLQEGEYRGGHPLSIRYRNSHHNQPGSLKIISKHKFNTWKRGEGRGVSQPRAQYNNDTTTFIACHATYSNALENNRLSCIIKAVQPSSSPSPRDSQHWILMTPGQQTEGGLLEWRTNS